MLDIPMPDRDGTAIFLQNTLPQPIDWLMAMITGSPLAHVAVFMDGFVYEATPPMSRRIPWSQWVAYWRAWAERFPWVQRLGGYKEVLWVPDPPLEDWQLYRMREKADSMLGIRYSMVLNYLFGLRDRIHCSQLAGVIYFVGGVIGDYAGHRETPGSLKAKLDARNEGVRAAKTNGNGNAFPLTGWYDVDLLD